MTVDELIDRLKECDPEANVYYDCDGLPTPLTAIEENVLWDKTEKTVFLS